MEITIYTIITNDYDDLEELSFKEEGIRYVVYTDNPELKSETWEVIHVPGLYQRHYKCLPPLKGITVYIDGNIIIKKPLKPLVQEVISNNKLFGFYSAVDNQCAYLEADTCLNARYASEENLTKAKNYLREQGYPENNGMVPTCFLIRNHYEEVTKQGELWFKFIKEIVHIDQVSFNYTLWKIGLENEVFRFPNNVYDDEYILWKKTHKIKK
jgi:hypothetical protein